MSCVRDPSTSPRPSDPTAVVEAVHHLTAPGGRCLICVTAGDPDVEVTTWPIADDAGRAAESLIGTVAPPGVEQVGLSVPARATPLEAGGEALGPVRLTVLVDRAGAVATAIEPGGGEVITLTEPPAGWVPDLLARSLGLPTPAPEGSPLRFVETAWLDSIAAFVLADPTRRHRWDDLARRHPLAAEGPSLPGPLLALEAKAHALDASWSGMRRRWERPALEHPLPPFAGWRAVPLDEWFDDGSFARWLERDLPPAEALLEVLLGVLPDRIGRELVDALVTVAPPKEPPR